MLGTTTPDVLYRAPDEDSDDVGIYMDGLSGHIHGNPETAERDRAIRTWLRNNGYEVIEIAANELDDPDAMTRHFRRLAGYLNAPDRKDALKKDPSWYGRAAEAAGRVGRRVLEVFRPRPGEEYAGCVPLVPLQVAAGEFSPPQTVAEGDWEWVRIDTHRTLRPGMFVAQVVGHSMEPAIPDGAYCLFSMPVTGTRQGRTVLVALRDSVDPENGQRYTVKRYSSEKAGSEDGTWRHVRVRLKPNNPEYQPIELTCEDEGSVAVVAEMVEVVGGMD